MTDADARTDPEALLAHGDFVRAIARSLLWDEHAAEDVVQQTWLAALGAPVGANRGWLAAVARNLAIKRIRGDRRRALRETAASRPEATPSDAEVLERERLRRSVVDEVLALPEPYRATVLLRYLESLPPRDVARRMDVPVETVRTRTRRAIEMLRVRLDGRHGDERGAFCGALAIWAGLPRASVTSTAATAAGLGGFLMASKTAVIGAVVVVAALTAWLLWPADGAPVQPANNAAAVAADAGAPKVRPPRARVVAEVESAAPAPPEPQKEPVVRGRVVDTQGRPLSGAKVSLLVGEQRRDAQGNLNTGELVHVTTDAEGQFQSTLPTAAKTAVQLLSDPAFESKSGRLEVVPPATGLEFVVERMPAATLVVTAFDVVDVKPIPQFTCTFFGRPGVSGMSTHRAVDGKVEAAIRLASASGETVRVVVASGGATAEREIAVRQGERVEVRMELQREGEVQGRVVDAAGLPVVNALAFFGEEDVARGDEPFKPFDEKRVRDGARTDGDGRFEMKGKGRWVTIWHADGGPVTVARADAGSIVLPARGVVRGVLRGPDGTPSPNTKVFLDRVREMTTDGEGRFEFKGVEPGTRGLSLTDRSPKAYFAVRVAPGATVDVEMRPGLPEVQIKWPGRTSLGQFVAVVPTAAAGSFRVGKPSEGGAIVVNDLLPGHYLLLGDGGAVAHVDVSGSSATATVGTGEIVVHAKPQTRLWVLPAGADYLTRILVHRVSRVGVPADGVQRFTGLAPGRYDVGVDLDGVRVTIEVKDGAVETTIE